MKKVIGLILISVIIMSLSINVFATGVLGSGTTTITGNEYQNAQKDDNDEENEVDKGTSNGNTTLPQTGIEDYGTGILLVVFAASAVFAFKKVSDYRDIK